MGFSIKKNRTPFGGNGYQKLRSIEDVSYLVHNRNSSISIPMAQSTYNKRFSEQSFNTVSTGVSTSDTVYSNYSTETESNYYNDVYAPNAPIPVPPPPKKEKKHRKRKALSKIFQSFSINDPLQQSMQSADFEYYCYPVRGSNYNFNYFPY